MTTLGMVLAVYFLVGLILLGVFYYMNGPMPLSVGLFVFALWPVVVYAFIKNM